MDSSSTKIKLEKIKIEKSDTKKNMRKIEREKYEIKIEVLNDLEMKEESETEYIDQLKREIRCLMRANTNAETGTKVWRRLYSDIELESKVKMLREAVNYEKELEGFRLRNGELLALVEEKRMECVGLEDKLNGLSSMKDAVDNELKGVRTECSELKKRVAELEDGHKVMCERERNQQEQILYLMNVKDKCEQLERKNMELEVEKDRLEEELDKRNRELDEEKRRECVGLLEQLNELRSMKDVVERKNVELEVEKNRLEMELIDRLAVCKDLKDQNSLLCEREEVAMNRINDVCEILRRRRVRVDFNRTDGANLGFSENDVSDNHEENNSRNEIEEIQTGSGNEREENMGGSRGRSEAIVSEIKKESEESLSERSSRNEGTQRQASVDLDDEAVPAVGGDYSIPIDIESDSVVEISDSENDDDSPPTYRLERPLSDQKCDEHLVSCKKEFPLCSTSKRKWGADAGTSEIKIDDEHKMKKLDAGKYVLLEPKIEARFSGI